MFAVSLVFVLNSKQFNAVVSRAYISGKMRAASRFLSHKWYFDTVYNRIINQPLLEGSYRVVFSLVDKGALEFFGPTSLSTLTTRASTAARFVQTGRVYDYAFLMIVAIYLITAVVSR